MDNKIKEIKDLIEDLKDCVDGNGVPNIHYISNRIADLDKVVNTINYSQYCKSDSELLVCGCGKNKPVTREPAYIHCDWCDRTYIETN